MVHQFNGYGTVLWDKSENGNMSQLNFLRWKIPKMLFDEQ